MTVAYQGAPGAFGHEACRAFMPDHRPVAVPTFAGVVSSVRCGAAEFGILPLANSRAGEVPGVRRLIEDPAVTIEAEYHLPVRLHLLGLRGSCLEQIRTVISHSMALRQCTQSLSRLRVGLREAPNTALAAKELDELEVAALASETAAGIYDRDILLHDLQDDPDNHTLFVLMRRA